MKSRFMGRVVVSLRDHYYTQGKDANASPNSVDEDLSRPFNQEGRLFGGAGR